jgi:sporulation protein YlmC with PRC-barrel domain
MYLQGKRSGTNEAAGRLKSNNSTYLRKGLFMKTKLLAGVSALVLLAVVPTIAAAQSNDGNPPPTATGSVGEDAEQAWEDIKEDTSEAYENVKATFIDDEIEPGTIVTIDERMTAAGMIGKPVENGNNERVGTVKDVILEKNGKASIVVVADGEFPGFSGKLVAFDYDSIARRNKDGDVIMPLTEDTIDNAAEFSYDPEKRSENVRVIPADGYSVEALLDGELLDERQETVAQIDNISFKNGYADQLIVAFDQVLGMSGEKAAFDYSDAKVLRKGEDELNLQLSANQTAQFEAYKKATTN